MKSTKNKILFLTIVLGVTISVGVIAWLLYENRLLSSDKTPFSTTFYLNNIDWNVGDFFVMESVRREKHLENALLIKGAGTSYENSFYKFELEKRVLARISEEEWQNSQEQTNNCREADVNYQVKLAVKTVILPDKSLQTFGKYPLVTRLSPNKNTFAVISTEGPITDYPSYFFLGGGSSFQGKAFLEMFSMPDGERLKETVEIRIPKNISDLNLCWAADSSMLVIKSANTFTSIVEVEKIPSLNNN